MFALPKNDNIFIGVDYECWNKTKQPIQLSIEKESVNKVQFKNIKNKFEILDYQDEDNGCYYISLAKNLKYENITDDIIKIISDIEKILK
jgi:hypothetical protein